MSVRPHDSRSAETNRPPEKYFRGRAFTLVEMVVSLVVVALLIAGMSSAIVLASKALPHATNPAGATVDTARALHQLRDDLRAAVELPVFGESTVTLHLPDRDGDGRPEVITWAWAGNAGDPLTRTANGGAAVEMLDNLQSFTLDYHRSDQATALPAAVTTSAETELARHDPGDSPDSLQISDRNCFGFRFLPSLPAGAERWRVTRVLLRTSGHANDNGQATFNLAKWNAGVGPDPDAVESVDVPETQLDQSGGWAQIDFARGGPFSEGETVAVTIDNTGAATPGNVTWNNIGTPANFYESDDGGETWQVSTSEGAIDHYVYGTYETTGEDWTFTRQHITSVRIGLIHRGANAVTHALTVPLPNAPEAADASWEADFNADPTAQDHDADGAAEWHDAGGFDAADLIDGRWRATDTLASSPSGVALNEPFVFEVWLEDTTDNGLGGDVHVRFDRDFRGHALVTIGVHLETDGQVITVGSETAAGTPIEWVRQTLPAGQNAHVRILADPANDTLGVSIDGEVAGSFVYEQITGLNTDVVRSAVDGPLSGVMIDHLRLTTGGTVTVTPGAYRAEATETNSADSGLPGVVGDVLR